MTTVIQLHIKEPAATNAEIELLLCCARTNIAHETAERIKTLLQQDIDWTYLMQTADHHRVIPLLYQSLKATCAATIPQIILAQLRSHFHINAIHNLFLTQELLKLLHLFEVHGINTIPYKGPVLAASAYNSLALRQFSDLDVLVCRQDVKRTQELLMSLGYQLQLDLGWELHFVHPETNVSVDLHQAITPKFFSFPLDFEQLWSRLKPLSIEQATVSNLSPEDTLLILSSQVGKDCCHWRLRLAQLCDTAELLRTYPQLDWVRVLEQTRTLGSQRMLLLNLLLVSNLFGTALPEAVLNMLQADLTVTSLATQVCLRLWSEADDPPIVSKENNVWSWSYNHWFYLRMRERFQDRVTYCFGWLRIYLNFMLLPNEKDRALLALPRIFFFLYYPLHLIRLIDKYGLIPLKQRLGF